MHAHTLIPNTDPTLRVLLHHAPDCHVKVYVTVETLDHDAIGAPQWRIRDDSRTEKICLAAAVALIAHAKPAALGIHNTDATVLGTCEHDAHRYRCSVHRSHGALVLVTEIADLDQVGITRWNIHSRDSLTDKVDNRIIGLVDADALIDCLYPSA